MDLTLSMISDELDPEDVHALSLDLGRSLGAEVGADAVPVEEVTAGSTRGDLVTIGTLAVTFLTSGAAVALLKVFKAYFERSSSVTVELARPDGAKLTVKADDLRAGQFDRTLYLARQFLEERQP